MRECRLLSAQQTLVEVQVHRISTHRKVVRILHEPTLKRQILNHQVLSLDTRRWRLQLNACPKLVTPIIAYQLLFLLVLIGAELLIQFIETSSSRKAISGGGVRRRELGGMIGIAGGGVVGADDGYRVCDCSCEGGLVDMHRSSYLWMKVL